MNVAILTCATLKSRNFKKDKGHYVMMKGLNHQEDVDIDIHNHQQSELLITWGIHWIEGRNESTMTGDFIHHINSRLINCR